MAHKLLQKSLVQSEAGQREKRREKTGRKTHNAHAHKVKVTQRISTRLTLIEKRLEAATSVVAVLEV